MSFTQAVSDGFAKYVVFSGRSSRSAYWWWALFSTVLTFIAYGVGLALDAVAIYYVVALALFLPSLAVGVRRLHDIGRSGWWYLIGIIPLIGAVTLLIWFVTPSRGANDYGSGPDEASTGHGALPAH
ncbi:MAG: DUF805 domain-containing protein [Solirubrobacteraceae bacterium]